MSDFTNILAFDLGWKLAVIVATVIALIVIMVLIMRQKPTPPPQ